MTDEQAREVGALIQSIGALVLSVTRALADGVLTLEEVVAIGCDVPSLVRAIAELATPTEEQLVAARRRLAAGRVLVRRRRAQARIRKLRESRRVAASPGGLADSGGARPPSEIR